MTTSTSRGKNGYIPTLDGLRAVAILLVIFSHFFDRNTSPLLVYLGHVGVLIFFALSGYLITTRLLEEFYATGRISLRNFYLRRVFRILPPALFYLGIVSILTSLGVVVCSWSAIRSAVLLYCNYAAPSGAGWKIGHFWSLSVEEHFYLFWPCLLILFGVRKGWRTAVFLAAGVSVWRVLDDRYDFIVRAFHAPFLGHNGFRTDVIADTLLWGCCLAFFFRPPLRYSLSSIRSTILAITSATALVVLVCWQLNHTTFLAHIMPTILLGAVVAAPQAPIGRFLELPPLRFIGKLSYSLYIWQQFFIGGSGWHLPLPLNLVAILGCAYFSYTIVEQPSIRFGRRFLARKKVVGTVSGPPVLEPNPMSE